MRNDGVMDRFGFKVCDTCNLDQGPTDYVGDATTCKWCQRTCPHGQVVSPAICRVYHEEVK